MEIEVIEIKEKLNNLEEIANKILYILKNSNTEEEKANNYNK